MNVKRSENRSQIAGVRSIVLRSEFCRKIFIVNDKLINDGAKMQQLQHPSTGNTASFFIFGKNKCLFEVLQFNQPHRSWLVNESVSSEGKCYITVSVDIMFFVLYYLRKNCLQQAIPVEQWNVTDPSTAKMLLDISYKNCIDKIADRKTSGDIVAYKYNGQKSLAWLALKVKLLANALKRKSIYSGSSAKSANYMKSEIVDPVEEKVYLENACGLVGSYIEEELHDELLSYFSIEDENNGPKRKSVQLLETEQASKKIKTEGEGLQELKREKEKKHSSKEKAFAKAAVGSKSIASFFK